MKIENSDQTTSRGGDSCHVTLFVCTATHCNILQHYATHCNTLQHKSWGRLESRHIIHMHCNTVQHNATHCNTMQHTATEVVKVTHACERPTSHYPYAHVLQCVAVFCIVLHCVALCCSVLQCVAVHRSVLQCLRPTHVTLCICT